MLNRNYGGQETLRRSSYDSGGRGGQTTTAAVWAAVLGISVGEAWLRRHETKSPETLSKFENAMQQIERGVPFAYATERVGFRTLDLAIDRRALIPRPETEGLVDLVLAETRHLTPDTCGLVADIGTGSGCIALSLAVEGNFERVIAVEKSPAAAALARENIARVAPRTPVEMREGNLLEPLGDKRGQLSVIVSNPPYLTAAEYGELEPSVREFEPMEALVSGADGLDATRALLADAATFLVPGGVLVLEIDERRGAAVEALAKASGWRRVSIHNDLFGCPRYALAFKED